MVRSLTLLVVGALTLFGCASMHMDPPQVSVVGVEPAPSEGIEPRMQLKLRVQNRNDAPIEYNGIFVELDVQGKTFASGVSSERGTVPAFSEADMTVPVTVSVFSLAGQAMGLLSGKAAMDKITFELRGKLSGASSGTLPFKSQGALNLADLASGSK